MIAVSVPYAPLSVLTGDDRFQRLYHCLNDSYLIEVYNAEGRLFRRIDRPYERVRVTAADKEEYLARTASASKEVRELYESLAWPDVKTVTDRMLCDDRGFLWVATNEVKDEAEKKVTAYDIFDAEGSYDARVWARRRPRQVRRREDVPLQGRQGHRRSRFDSLSSCLELVASSGNAPARGGSLAACPFGCVI